MVQLTYLQIKKKNNVNWLVKCGKIINIGFGPSTTNCVQIHEFKFQEMSYITEHSSHVRQTVFGIVNFKSSHEFIF